MRTVILVIFCLLWTPVFAFDRDCVSKPVFKHGEYVGCEIEDDHLGGEHFFLQCLTRDLQNAQENVSKNVSPFAMIIMELSPTAIRTFRIYIPARAAILR